jgi:predicted Zn-dependent peptidase
MKKLLLIFLAALSLQTNESNAQNRQAQQVQYTLPNPDAKNYPFETAPNDPLKARIYKLQNGLTVYLSDFKDAPRIQTYIVTKAGSKNDPADATGLAHYLEHMLFKGTDQYGSLDYSKEKPLLDKIEALYEDYRATTDPKKREVIYKEIDSISGVAAKFAIANEYDKLLSSIGAKGTNAYTSFEQTVYVNDIPSNQLEKWIQIEAERFRNPVLRIFHTELEAVYEEKNRGLDNDGRKVFENLFEGLFAKHQYGTQTTIGTIDHLKNPSIKKIKEYYDKYYVPNNMAICISGDIDFDKTIKMIDSYFGKLVSKPVPEFVVAQEDAIKAPIVKEVLGPDAENVTIGFRGAGVQSRDADLMYLLSKILYNGTAGLYDLKLNQEQKVIDAYCFPYILRDYSMLIVGASPVEGQTLEQVKDLLLEQLKNLASGNFPDWILPAITNDIKLEELKTFQNNSGRADAFVDAFVNGIAWSDYIQRTGRISKIKREELIDFVKRNFADNYVIVYKRVGEDKSVKKVVKPAITPVELNRDAQSVFLKQVTAIKPPEIEPVFVDFDKDITKRTVNGLNLFYTINPDNALFNAWIRWPMGSNNDPKMAFAMDYLQFLGAGTYTPTRLKEEFYKLGCSFSVSASEDEINLRLEGLSENFDQAFKLLNLLLTDPKADDAALANLVSSNLKRRQDDKLSKGVILWGGMVNYGKYGANNPFRNILSEAEMKALKSADLIAMIKQLNSYEHEMFFWGPLEAMMVENSIKQHHVLSGPLKPVPAEKTFSESGSEEGKVYVIDYDMKQAEIIMLSKDQAFDPALNPQVTLYNEYFGAGMGSLVFQTIRESKALAYGVRSTYQQAGRKDRSNFVFSYIGTQSDKLPEATESLLDLMNNLPKTENAFNNAKESVLQVLRTERITGKDKLTSFIQARKKGVNVDLRKEVFQKVPSMTFADLETFHKAHFGGKKLTILVLGKKENLNLTVLEKYGKVTPLTLTEVFGY